MNYFDRRHSRGVKNDKLSADHFVLGVVILPNYLSLVPLKMCLDNLAEW